MLFGLHWVYFLRAIKEVPTMGQNKLVLIIAILSLAVIGLVAEVAILIGRSEPSQTISNQPSKEAFPNYPEYQDETLISEARNALGSLRTALEARAADKGYYADTDDTNSIYYLETEGIINSVARLEASWNSQTYDIDKSTYQVTITAKDRNNTQLILTPKGIRP
jgi:hypothetical protein